MPTRPTRRTRRTRRRTIPFVAAAVTALVALAGAEVSPAATTKKATTSITVPSTTAQYFVLWVKPDAGSSRELAVAVVRGKAGTTTITDGRTALPSNRYRVETRQVAKPGDVDNDGVDDLTELADLKHQNPLNAAPSMDISNGAVYVPDRKTYELLSYQGDDVARDAYLAGIEFVKFWITETDTANPSVYYMNTESFRAHPMFAAVVGIAAGRGPAPGKMRGDIAYDPKATAPDGTKGRYRFAFQPNDAYPFADIALAYEALVTSMPFIAGKLVYEPYPQAARPLYEAEKALYAKSRVPVSVAP